MIGEKEIERAANEYNPNVDMFARNERAAFKDGVDWFKKALWHSQDEIPEDGRIILIKGWFNCTRSGNYIIVNTTEDINYDDVDPDREFQWGCFCSYAVTPITWCYIEDLLPNK